MRYERVVACNDCRGSGAAPGTAPETCSACNGRGRVRFQQGILPIAVERVVLAVPRHRAHRHRPVRALPRAAASSRDERDARA